MSSARVIDYRALSVSARVTCQEGLKQLCKMDKLLEEIKMNASKLQTREVREYEKFLVSERNTLERQLNIIVERTKTDHKDASISSAASEIKAVVNRLVTGKLIVIEELINKEIVNYSERLNREYQDSRDGVVNLDDITINNLYNIEDVVLRNQIYKVILENKEIVWSDAVAKAEGNIKELHKEIIVNNRDKLMKSFVNEMKESGVENSMIEEIKELEINSINEYEEVHTKVVEEKIREATRKETIKIILSTIKSKGFTVDKKNIKIDREKNEVKLIARKTSGERAEFRVYLDGRFIYKFDNYEGQACKKDIEPFMSDLEDIYGFKVDGSYELWSNPDKNASMKYQSVNENKGKR